MNGGILKITKITGISLVCVLALTSAEAALALGTGPDVQPLGLEGGECGGSTLGAAICNVVAANEMVPGLFSGLSYLFGIVLGVLGIMKLVEHIQNPHQTPPWDFMKRFLAGGAFFALPMVMEAAQRALIGDGGADIGVGIERWNVEGVAGGGLDAMVVALVADVWGPMQILFRGFCYLAGIILIMIGITRLLKTAQEGPRGPGGIGTIMTFITAGALLSLDAMLGSWTHSLFGTDDVASFGVLAFQTGLEDSEIAHIHSLIGAVIAFMMILGWISFIRGWFILRDVAEGNQQASMMAGLTHLFGGALAVNLGPVLNAVQSTFGLTGFGVNFSV